MGVIVKVTRRGQTTLPMKHRASLGIKEGDRLIVEETAEGLLLRRVPDIMDLAGVDAKYGTVEEARRMIERMREEY